MGLEGADTRGGTKQPSKVDSELREGILLEGRHDIAVVVVVGPRAAVITGPGIVQTTDSVGGVTTGAGH